MDWICKQLAHSGSPFVPPSPCQTSSSSSSLHHKLKTNGRRNSSRNDNNADDRNDEEDAADDRPLLHGEKSARQQQDHHLLMTASNDLQQQRQQQQQRWRQNRKSRSRTRWKRKSDDGGEGGGIKAAVAEINGRDRMEAGSRLVAFALCMLLLITIFLLLMDWTLLDPTFAHVPVDRSNIRWLELERICSGSKLPVQRNVVDRNATNNNNGNGTQSKGRERQQNCCIVVDIIHLKRNSAKRALFFGSPVDNPTNFSAPDFESEVQLMRPKGMSVHDSDTRLWAIDSGHLMNEYVAAMALLPFVTGSLSEEQPLTEVAAVGDGKSGKQHNVLVIGLGGATLDMFWHRRFPWLNISVYELDPAVAELATRWFGAVNDGTRRTIVADGLLAIREAAEQGSLYDTVVLDACDLGGQQPPAMMPCPSGQFLGPYVLPLIRSVLAPMGTFVLNALPLREEEPNVQRLQRKLLSVFPTCVRTRMARQMNNIFACLPYAIQPKTVEPTIGLWNERMMRLVHKMGFERLLAGANLTINGGNETTAAMNSSSSILKTARTQVTSRFLRKMPRTFSLLLNNDNGG